MGKLCIEVNPTDKVRGLRCVQTGDASADHQPPLQIAFISEELCMRSQTSLAVMEGTGR